MFRQLEEGVEISLYIQPQSSKTEIAGEYKGLLKLKIKAPPVDGKANAEVIRFLSEVLDVPKSSIDLIKGEKSREKKVLVRGLILKSVYSKIP